MGSNFNKHIYKEECLGNILLPFTKKHYRSGKYVFWPDLASHYSKMIQDWFCKQKISFVQKKGLSCQLTRRSTLKRNV